MDGTPSAPFCHRAAIDFRGIDRATRLMPSPARSVFQNHLGDVGSVLSGVEYQRLVMQGQPRAFTIRGLRGIYGHTEHSTGVFCSNTGHAVQIDHGVMGVVPLLLMSIPPINWYGEGEYAKGVMLNFPEEVVVVIQHGVLTAASGYDRRFILDTRTESTTTDEGEVPLPADEGMDEGMDGAEGTELDNVIPRSLLNNAFV